MKGKILKAVSYGLATLGAVASGAASIGCILLFFDEPNAPKHFIEQ